MLPKLEIDPTGAPPKGRGARKWLLVAFMIAMVPIVALAILWGIARTRAAARLHKAVAEAEAMDPGRWRLADVWANRARVPEDENSATLLARAVRDMPPNWFGDNSPEVSEERRRRFELLLRLTLIDRRSEPTEVVPPADAAWLRAELAALGPMLDALRALANRPHGRYATQPAAIYIMTPVTHLGAAGLAGRLLLLDAVRRAAEHDIDGALDDVRATVNVGRSVGDEPMAVSQRRRIAQISNALHTLQRVLAQGEPSDGALRKLDDLLAIEAREPILNWAITGERAGTFDTLERLADGRLSFNLFVGTVTRTRATYWLAPPRVAYQYNAGLVLDLMNEAVALSRRPPRELPSLWLAWQGRVGSERGGYVQRIATAPSMLVLPAIAEMANLSLEYAAELAVARTLIAAERYRLAHGDWPATIDDLVPEFLPAPLDDPLGTGPIRLRRDEDGVVVYSVGSDGQDQGGRQLKPVLQSSYNLSHASDVGLRLYDPLQRRRPAGRVTPLPENVFAPESP